MVDADKLHLREDLTKNENRINVSMFGLMTQCWFRKWVLDELHLPCDSIIYPTRSEEGFRPDFEVANPVNESVIAWIEVELRYDIGQVKKYRDKLHGPVKTIWGREVDKGDLSLERIAEFLDKRRMDGDLSPQAQVNVTHLHSLIAQGLNGYRSASKRAQVSENVKTHWFLRELSARLGTRLRFDLGKVRPGEFKVDTVGPEGFSLRVFSQKSTSGEVSIVNRRAGRDRIRLSSRRHLRKYLPDHDAEIGAYVDMLKERIGCEIDTAAGEGVIDRDEERERLKGNFDEFVKHLEALARSRPST